MSHLSLIVPGLLGPWAAEFRGYVCEGLEAPALGWLLSRAGRVPAGSRPAGSSTLHEALVHALSLPHICETRFPSAAFSALADGLTVAPGEVLARLDPVHLTATPHGAQIAAGAQLGLTPDEADELVSHLNEELAAPWRIERGDAARWYVRLSTLPAVHTVPPSAVFGPDRPPLLPEGDDGRDWRRWMTEAQMLLHAHPLNTMREQASQQPVNSVWLWGQGALPQAMPADRPGLVLADDPVVRGVARWLDVASEPGSASIADALRSVQPGTVLVVLDDCEGRAAGGDVEGWRAALERLDRHCFEPVQQAFGERLIHTLDLYMSPAPRCRLGGLSRLRWWRRKRPLSEWLSDE